MPREVICQLFPAFARYPAPKADSDEKIDLLKFVVLKLSPAKKITGRLGGRSPLPNARVYYCVLYVNLSLFGLA